MKLEKIVLEGERFRLRTIESKDIDSITKYCKDRLVSRWLLRVPYPYKRKDAEDFIKRNRKKELKGEARRFGIEIDGEIVGVCSLESIDLKNKNAELGYWLGKPFWKKGYMTEAVKMVVEYGFKKMKLERIYASALDVNIGSQKVLKKLGFKKEGISRKEIFKNNRWYNRLWFGLLKDEYKKS